MFRLRSERSQQLRYHSLYVAVLIPLWETVSVGQFAWGGCLLKCNGGVQRFACYGWKPCDDLVWDEEEVATLKNAAGEIVAGYPESA